MATYCSILARRIPWTKELAGFSPQNCKESDTTEATQHPHSAYTYSMFQNVPESERHILALFLLCVGVLVTQLCPTLRHHGLQPSGLFFFSWDTLGKNPRVGCYFLLQIFPTQVSNLGLLHCRQTLDRLSCQGSSLFLLSGSISLSSLSSPHSCLLIAQSLQFLKTELRTSLLKCA